MVRSPRYMVWLCLKAHYLRARSIWIMLPELLELGRRGYGGPGERGGGGIARQPRCLASPMC